MAENKLYQMDQRTEHVQHIIERMPNRFGFWVTLIVLFLFAMLFVFGWLVRYPDVVTGEIIINANVAPLKLVANTNGKLKFSGVNSMDAVKEGQIIAYLDNPTNPISVVYIDSLLKLYNPNTDDIMDIRKKIPYNFSLGELNAMYYAFANSLQDFINYKTDRLFDKQGENLSLLLKEQRSAIASTEKQVEMAMNMLDYVSKFYSRDSTLFSKRAISESELDKSQMTFLSNKNALQNAINNHSNASQSAQQTENKLQELNIEKFQKGKELRISLISTYNDLVDNIKSWEQKYVFKSPFNGKVQFLKFYNENQFVQEGEKVFTIVPKEDKAFGQVILPAQGSGKIKLGQEVIVKLDNFPYLEYGSISGTVKSISLTTNTAKTEKSDIETYLVLVDFPNKLKTNFRRNLDFKAEAKGTAEIITNDRRFIQRLFDNLKYVLNK